MISVSIVYLLGQVNEVATSTSTIDYSSFLGTYMLLGFASPIIITLGLMLVYPEGHKKIRFLIAGILSTVLLIGGATLNIYMNTKNMLLNSTIGFEITAEGKEDSSLDFTVEEEREAAIVVVVMNGEGDYNVRIDGDKGVSVINAPVPEGMVRTLTYNVKLPADHYIVTFEAGDNAIGENPQFQIMIR